MRNAPRSLYLRNEQPQNDEQCAWCSIYLKLTSEGTHKKFPLYTSEHEWFFEYKREVHTYTCNAPIASHTSLSNLHALRHTLARRQRCYSSEANFKMNFAGIGKELDRNVEDAMEISKKHSLSTSSCGSIPTVSSWLKGKIKTRNLLPFYFLRL